MTAPANADFYKADGTFDADKAKAAYYALMEYHDYPIPEFLKGDDFWTLDFGLGKFSEVGMAGVFWINNMEHDYMGHEIFLLPGQMIPEHWHVETKDARAKADQLARDVVVDIIGVVSISESGGQQPQPNYMARSEMTFAADAGAAPRPRRASGRRNDRKASGPGSVHQAGAGRNRPHSASCDGAYAHPSRQGGRTAISQMLTCRCRWPPAGRPRPRPGS